MKYFLVISILRDTPNATPPENEALIAGPIKGKCWLIVPDHKAGYFLGVLGGIGDLKPLRFPCFLVWQTSTPHVFVLKSLFPQRTSWEAQKIVAVLFECNLPWKKKQGIWTKPSFFWGGVHCSCSSYIYVWQSTLWLLEGLWSFWKRLQEIHLWSATSDRSLPPSLSPSKSTADRKESEKKQAQKPYSQISCPYMMIKTCDISISL